MLCYDLCEKCLCDIGLAMTLHSDYWWPGAQWNNCMHSGSNPHQHISNDGKGVIKPVHMPDLYSINTNNECQYICFSHSLFTPSIQPFKVQHTTTVYTCIKICQWLQATATDLCYTNELWLVGISLLYLQCWSIGDTTTWYPANKIYSHPDRPVVSGKSNSLMLHQWTLVSGNQFAVSPVLKHWRYNNLIPSQQNLQSSR